MYINSIELENIKSYEKLNLRLQKGINFFSGDIGSGKSSILDAIEFALFGFKKGDIEGNSILRKGKNQGFVKLIINTNDLEYETIEIFRKIKKNKAGSILQENGYIKINNNLIELSPSEINSKVFEIFNFPKSFISKDKNLIYRFTIYTAQDSLKDVLFADSEKRLEIIRKIFDIDKYKQIKNAINIYSSKIREDKIKIKSKLEDKNEVEIKLKQLNENKNTLKINNDKLKENKIKINENIEKYQTAINKREEQLEKNLDLKTKLEKAISTIDEIKNQQEKYQIDLEKKEKNQNKFNLKETKIQLDELKEREKELNQEKQINEKQIKIIKEQENKFEKFEKEKEELNKQLKENENLNFQIKTKKSSFDLILTQCQIKDIEIEIEKNKLELKKLDKKKKEKEELNQNKQEIINKITLLNKEKEEKEESIKNISKLENCPTCLQDVSCEHKDNILKKLNKQINSIEIQITKLQEKIDNIQTQENEKYSNLDKNYTTKQSELISKEESLKLLINKLNNEREQEKHINEIEKELIEKTKIIEIEKKVQKLEKELNKKKQLNIKLEELNKNTITLNDSINNINLKSEKINNIIKENQNLNQEKLNLEKQININKKKIEKEKEYKIKLNKLEENLEKLKKDKTNLNEKYLTIMSIREKNSNKLTEIKTNLEHIENEIEIIKNKNQKLEENQKEYDKIIYKEDLLLNKITNISNLIEKGVFTKYYIEFNEEFEKIFHQLIEDNNIEVRLSDDFSIIVEQNEYDIDIKNLSGGEKSSLALAYRLALKKIIEDNLSNESKLSMLILDEPTDGFSENQVTRLGEILKNSNLKQIIIVSHDEKIESISNNTLHIDKINHKSKIIENQE